jgi:hypothetical protein
MRCLACDRMIEDLCLDETIELCNKCFSASNKALDELLDQEEQKKLSGL